MNRIVKSFLPLITLTLFMGVTAPGWAQLKFRTLAGDIAPEDLYYFQNKQDVPITVQQDMRSLPFSYSGSNPLVLYKMVSGTDGKMLRVAIASIDLQVSGTQPLLQFFKDSNAPGKIRILVMKEDLLSFPSADCRFANFSQCLLEIGYDKEKFTLSPGSVIDRKPSGPTVMLSVKALTATNTTVPLLTHNMVCRPSERYLIVADPSTNGVSPVEIKLLTDTISQ